MCNLVVTLWIASLKKAYHNKFHPIKSMIESKTWDGVERIETLFIDYLGAEDNHYNREVTKNG